MRTTTKNRSILGSRIRERRRELGITQADLAQRIHISPSYLNLIEHNKRNIGGTLLKQIADSLSLGLEDLDGVVERRLMSTLDEIAHTPDIASLGVEADRIGEFIGQYPGWARVVAALARAEHEANQTARALSDRLTHDAFLGESVHKMLSRIASIRSAGEILKEHQDIDPILKDQFQNIVCNESHSLTQIGETLATYFNKSEVSETVLTPLDEVEAFFESHGNRFTEIENAVEKLSSHFQSANFMGRTQLARELAENNFNQLIESLINNFSGLETEIAKEKATEQLLTYTTHALLVPMATFEPMAIDLKFDIETLAEQFSVDEETICLRLTALERKAGLPQFGYILANASGSIITMRNLPDLSVPRYTSACPLWALFRAQQSPETIIRQRVLFPTGDQYVFVARARHVGASGFGKARHYLTDMLVIQENDAFNTVYYPDKQVPLEQVGSSCRSCPRPDCMHRVSDPLEG